MKENKYCLGWGESVCVRECLPIFYKEPNYSLNLSSMSYPPDEGEEKLVIQLKKYIKQTTGLDYKYLIVTAGATPAINTVLRVMSPSNGVVSTRARTFPFYPKIIAKNDFLQMTDISPDRMKTTQLIDMPSNVCGSLDQDHFDSETTIWDSVYFNKVYINSIIPQIRPHRVNIGSLSKSLGLTGLRIGYIATNREEDYKAFLEENLVESCGVSVPSQKLATNLLKNIDLDIFMKYANVKVNLNRDFVSKISYLFDRDMNNDGMFYSGWTDTKALDLFERAGVTVVVLGEQSEGRFVRVNLGQNNDITRKAIRSILKEDKVK